MNSSELFSTSTTSSRAIDGDSNNNKSHISSNRSISNSRRASRDFENLSLEISKYPGDLFQRFLPTNSKRDQHPPPIPQPKKRPGKESPSVTDLEDDEDLELSLGLSLGGKFGVNKSHNGIKRSSSIAGTFPLFKEDDTVAPPPSVVPALVRTSSLPVESEDEWRKRKELQQLRRLAAKRRRSEKQRTSKESIGGGEDTKINLNVRGKLEKDQQFMGLGNKNSSSMVTSSGLNLNQLPVGGGRQGGSDGGGDVVLKKRSFFSSLQGLLAQQHGSQGSAESQSSGASDPEIKSVQGSNELRSPGSTHSQHQEGGTHEATCSGNRNPDTLSKQPDVAKNKRRELGASAVEDMPCVFTIGDPPNGRKVEGILYKYGKGEEVRLMCVCHGSFFSPAEFVKHAGGRDVEHPLRHIVVNPSPAAV